VVLNKLVIKASQSLGTPIFVDFCHSGMYTGLYIPTKKWYVFLCVSR